MLVNVCGFIKSSMRSKEIG
jgi:hypothetical protein